ncbi:AAA family ATPase [Occultella gossypii]|uniref:AAA family ATPase n=1 Tax=Occultella gossypii TaxID=2800820 RepID=A0ABS7SFM4_9MICO|nr:AAA family ATPase [Occultella gossypii]MBZ2199027.1 AAA family ATPase [Occultella gossypii]
MRLVRPAEPEEFARARSEQLTAGGRGPLVKSARADGLRSPGVVAALLAMTGDRCAYCETPIDPDTAVVTHHRPPGNAVDEDGSVSPDHYRWLEYTWSNLLPACADCVRAKGSRFPVRGARSDAPEPWTSEDALLLDPGREDLAAHLLYQVDGTVAGTTERGRVTIEVLALNRSSLAARRANLTPDAFPSMTERGVGHTPAMALPRPGYDLNLPLAPTQATSYYGATKWIDRVVIGNFRPIRDLDLDFSTSTSSHGPWTVLLGENGCGKSSILHAIALTLIGGAYRRELAMDAGAYLRHRARVGRVQVYLTGDSQPFELTWGTGDTDFTGPEAAPVLLLGYGATRLLPRGPAPQRPDRAGAWVDNLFDPFRPLTDPTAWLLSLPETVFTDVAEGLADLLALEDSAEIEADRRRKVVRIHQHASVAELTELSDGYQSMLVLACDVLRTVLTRWDQVGLAEGIVLIDELGAHLHPRWRMRIVTALRTLMPRVQFIVSTHDPLCLRGLLDGEVTVIRRNAEADVIAITDLPSVQGMRVDQLLTSEHFGLGSTDDPELDDLWAQYYQLQGLSERGAEQESQLAHVRARLDAIGVLGSTERDRLLLASADEFIARRRQVGDEVTRTSAEVTSELAALWTARLPGPPAARGAQR